MRTFDHHVDLDLAGSRRPVPSLLARFRLSAVRMVRTWRNRVAIGHLNELDDHQLLDIGLRRADIAEAMTSTFFADPGLHLTITARERARRHIRSGRTD
ncbi:DUF1127 domain-containing protein [Rhizobium sp. TRM96647]|uniref:DUF1127 domain-containing protein n=1 Tax=unclassified Rhizobium TaxID=2613769 RepID=UPI0021E9AC36|nr:MULTISPECIES: DUF1127 domain-containing protein [unclassified Rhizobium]MCV3739108.1 DUF1127 domain-containing protein [Rhizobium sp. TRM96647]MCV3760749.1 DUF1127 domain-containing protein [Rhizobium sp. TRM96650]